MSDEEYSSDPEEPFEDWSEKHLNLSYFPDPATFLPIKRLGIDSPQTFASHWKTKYGQQIIRFKSFNGQPCEFKFVDEPVQMEVATSPKKKGTFSKIEGKTDKIREQEKRLGVEFEDDYETTYIVGKMSNNKFAQRWNTSRGLIFGPLTEGRQCWVDKFNLPRRNQQTTEEQQDDSPKLERKKQCEVCHIDDVDLEKAHWIANCDGGDRKSNNILRLCPNCHTKLDQQRDPKTTRRAERALLYRAVTELLESDDADPRSLQQLCHQILERKYQ